MPSRNSRKTYIAQSYYHIYNRGVNKRKIFLDNDDYAVFLNLLKRHLSKMPVQDKKGREYPWLYPEIELLAFCLISNHFHLFVYQESENAISKLAQSVSTAYTVYFNKKYKRIGPLFQNRFRAVRISDDAYLQHITRYIHLNPNAYKTWEFSSYLYYLGRKKAEWVRPERILGLFNSVPEYIKFIDDYTDYRRTIDDLKALLA